MTVAKMTPKASEIAMGMKKKVSGLLLNISGTRPMKVVTEVSRMGRKRVTPAATTASMSATPCLRLRLI